MPGTITRLLRRNLHDVFGENDQQRRRAAIAEIFVDDPVFHAPDGIYTGRGAIDRVAAEIRATHPDFRYTEIGLADELGGSAGRISWVSGAPGQRPAYAGTDFIVVQDGRIAAIYLFFDFLPP